jgi:hypothetical protein
MIPYPGGAVNEFQKEDRPLFSLFVLSFASIPHLDEGKEAN